MAVTFSTLSPFSQRVMLELIAYQIASLPRGISKTKLLEPTRRLYEWCWSSLGMDLEELSIVYELLHERTNRWIELEDIYAR